MNSSSEQNRKLRILFLGFAYIVGVYQSKLKAIQKMGENKVAWLAPIKWKMHSWNRDIQLEVRYPEIQVYPAKIRFLNGVNGGYLYPNFSILNAVFKFKPDILHYEDTSYSFLLGKFRKTFAILQTLDYQFCT